MGVKKAAKAWEVRNFFERGKSMVVFSPHLKAQNGKKRKQLEKKRDRGGKKGAPWGERRRKIACLG